MIWGYRNNWGSKTIQEKLTKLTRILNYIMSSCIIFCIKMFEYSRYTCCLQEESTHFGLRVLTNFGQEVSKHFGLKKSNN